MSVLPVVVAWGGVISKVLVVGIASAAVAAFQALRRRRDLAPVREDIARVALAIDTPREGPIAVRGSYHISGKQLECSGERVVLDGDVSIVRGTAATWNGGARTYTLRDGDVVIAVGRMTRRAGGAVADYREAAGGWKLAASAGETAIKLCSVRPVATPKPLWPIRGVVVLCLVGIAAFYGLGWIGIKLVERRNYPRTELVEDDGVSTFRAELASALPRSRAKALIRLDIDLSYKPQTEHVLEERIALARLDGCLSESELLFKLERYDRAIEVARDCVHPEYARASLIALGRYDEAAQITAAPTAPFRDDRLIAAIGAGRWRDAVTIMETTKPTRDPDAAKTWGCITQYLKSLAGEPPATLETSTATCRVVASILAPDEHDDFADKHDAYDDQVQLAHWAFAGTPIDTRLGADVASWLAPFAVVQDSEVTHVFRGDLEITLGHHDVAATEFAKAEGMRAPPNSVEMRAYRAIEDRRFAHRVALRTGRAIAPFELDRTNPNAVDSIDEAAAIRSGVPVREAVRNTHVYPEGCRDAVTTGLADAAAGDGQGLARVLEGCVEPVALQLDTEYLFAVAPSVKSHRAELETAIRNWQTAGGTPFRQIYAFAVKRDLARLLGDTAEAERLQLIIERHAKVLTDRNRATAMFLVFAR